MPQQQELGDPNLPGGHLAQPEEENSPSESIIKAKVFVYFDFEGKLNVDGFFKTGDPAHGAQVRGLGGHLPARLL